MFWVAMMIKFHYGRRHILTLSIVNLIFLSLRQVGDGGEALLYQEGSIVIVRK